MKTKSTFVKVDFDVAQKKGLEQEEKLNAAILAGYAVPIPSMIKEGDVWYDMSTEEILDIPMTLAEYYAIPVRDRETFSSCGLSRDDYDKMMEEMNKTMTSPVTNKEWREFTDEFFIDVFTSALKRCETDYLIEFVEDIDMEGFLHNLFTSKQPFSNYLKSSISTNRKNKQRLKDLKLLAKAKQEYNDYYNP